MSTSRVAEGSIWSSTASCWRGRLLAMTGFGDSFSASSERKLHLLVNTADLSQGQGGTEDLRPSVSLLSKASFLPSAPPLSLFQSLLPIYS